jgi:hypothetical protein
MYNSGTTTTTSNTAKQIFSTDVNWQDEKSTSMTYGDIKKTLLKG